MLTAKDLEKKRQTLEKARDERIRSETRLKGAEKELAELGFDSEEEGTQGYNDTQKRIDNLVLKFETAENEFMDEFGELFT